MLGQEYLPSPLPGTGSHRAVKPGEVGLGKVGLGGVSLRLTFVAGMDGLRLRGDGHITGELAGPKKNIRLTLSTKRPREPGLARSEFQSGILCRGGRR